MTNTNQDPELLDDNEEGTGDASAYAGHAEEDYDPEVFELPNDYEYKEGEDDN